MSKRASILLVEDDRDERDVARRALQHAGVAVEIRIATDGVEAIEELGLDGRAEDVDLPAVVFLDLKLPRLDGWEVLRRIRQEERTAHLPVVALSTSARSDDIRRSYALGANSFLRKHFDSRGPGQYYVDAARYWVELNQSADPGRGE